jgi:SAM-dependent methyltransferase
LDKIFKKLNLGSGKFPKKHFVNLDIDPNSHADIIHDLEEFPWPLPSEHFELIEMDHILEHLSDLRKTFIELSRILAPNGILILRVPHFSRGFTHWDHKHGFDVSFPFYFQNNISGHFSNVSLRPVGTRVIWFGQHKFKKEYLSKFSYWTGKTLGYIFNFIGNLNHFFTSKLFCYWVGGYDEIEFVFKKI